MNCKYFVVGRNFVEFSSNCVAHNTKVSSTYPSYSLVFTLDVSSVLNSNCFMNTLANSGDNGWNPIAHLLDVHRIGSQIRSKYMLHMAS